MKMDRNVRKNFLHGFSVWASVLWSSNGSGQTVDLCTHFQAPAHLGPGRLRWLFFLCGHSDQILLTLVSPSPAPFWPWCQFSNVSLENQKTCSFVTFIFFACWTLLTTWSLKPDFLDLRYGISIYQPCSLNQITYTLYLNFLTCRIEIMLYPIFIITERIKGLHMHQAFRSCLVWSAPPPARAGDQTQGLPFITFNFFHKFLLRQCKSHKWLREYIRRGKNKK